MEYYEVMGNRPEEMSTLTEGGTTEQEQNPKKQEVKKPTLWSNLQKNK